ncbi:ATP-binding protein [Oerskovia sp. M15]
MCQEALTNILKHAGPDPTVTVVVTWGHDMLRLAVDDDGRGPPPTARTRPATACSACASGP